MNIVYTTTLVSHQLVYYKLPVLQGDHVRNILAIHSSNKKNKHQGDNETIPPTKKNRKYESPPSKYTQNTLTLDLANSSNETNVYTFEDKHANNELITNSPPSSTDTDEESSDSANNNFCQNEAAMIHSPNDEFFTNSINMHCRQQKFLDSEYESPITNDNYSPYLTTHL